MSENELDYLKIEGNVGAEDLLKRKLIDETPSRMLAKKIREGVIFRYLELSNIKIRDQLKISFFRPSLRREVPNGNSQALSEILESITISHSTLKSLEVVSL